MARRTDAVVPAPVRKTLLEWTEFDDGDATLSPGPACDAQAQALHLKILLEAGPRDSEPVLPLQLPAALPLPPLG